MAEQRIYEVVFIVDPDTAEEDVTRLTETLQGIITDQGGHVVNTEAMGRRHLAYRIGHKTEGLFFVFEVEGTGQEIAELERRMRVNDQVLRYLSVRVDEDRRRAEKFRERRARKAAKRPSAGGAQQQAESAGEEERAA